VEQARVAQVFLNLGHALDHWFMLIFPTVVLAAVCMPPQVQKRAIA
jgi:hypothetical protein